MILSNIYKEQVISNDINVDIINLIDITITIVIDSMPMPEIEREILIEILDNSLQLLKTELPTIEKEESNFLSIIYNFFTFLLSKIQFPCYNENYHKE